MVGLILRRLGGWVWSAYSGRVEGGRGLFWVRGVWSKVVGRKHWLAFLTHEHVLLSGHWDPVATQDRFSARTQREPTVHGHVPA